MNTWPPRNSVPDFEAHLRSLKTWLDHWGRRRVVGLLLIAAGLLWLASGLYVVGPGERGVTLLFGRVVGQTEPGLRYRAPAPIQQHNIVDVSTVRRAEVGFRAERGSTRAVPGESLMLTGDENIVDVQLFVQYLVGDPVKFLFRARNPEVALHSAAEVALRAAVGENTIDYTMTEGRVDVQDRVKRQLQELLDLYGTGLLVTEARLLVVDPPREVREAFHDVVRAWEDRERLIKEAEGYREDVLPKARGQAAEMVQAAEAYRQQRLIRAEGDATRFLSVLKEYRRAEVVTRDRLYLETIDRVLPQAQKFILDAGGERGGVLPLLPLQGFGVGSDGPRASGQQSSIQQPSGEQPAAQPVRR